MKLLDPLAADPSEWPVGSERVRAYAEAFARLGSDQLISNLQTRVRVLVVADHALPVTINETEYENTYVCSPYTAYASYAKEELRLIRHAPARWALGGLADITGRRLKSELRIEKVLRSAGGSPRALASRASAASSSRCFGIRPIAQSMMAGAYSCL